MVVLRIRQQRAKSGPQDEDRRISNSLNVLRIVGVQDVILRSSYLTHRGLNGLALRKSVKELNRVRRQCLIRRINGPLAFLLPIRISTPRHVLRQFTTRHRLINRHLFQRVLRNSTSLRVPKRFVLPIRSCRHLSRLSMVNVTLRKSISHHANVSSTLIRSNRLSNVMVRQMINALLRNGTAYHRRCQPLQRVMNVRKSSVNYQTLRLSRSRVLVLFNCLLNGNLHAIVRFNRNVLLYLLLERTLLSRVVLRVATRQFRLQRRRTAVQCNVTLCVVRMTVTTHLIIIVRSINARRASSELILRLHFQGMISVSAHYVALVFRVRARLILFRLQERVVCILRRRIPITLL